MYSTVTSEISVYDPYGNGKLLGSFSLNNLQLDALRNADLDTNRSYPIGYFLMALTPLEAPEAEATAVSEVVWQHVLESVKVPTRIPEE